MSGCASPSRHGKSASDPLSLARRCDRPQTGFDYKALWHELHVRSQLFAKGNDASPIAADVLFVDAIDTNAWKMIVLRDCWKCEWQYLLFTWDMSHWSFVGHIDVGSQPYVEPDLRFERTLDDCAQLVITSVSCWGTEVYDRKESWYTVHRGGIALEREVKLPGKEDE